MEKLLDLLEQDCTLSVDQLAAAAGIPVEEAKEPILPLWMFLCIQGGILIIGIPVTRKIVLSLHRRKLMKQEEAE